MRTFSWPGSARFVNRADDLAALDAWWAGSTRDALAMIGRRRVGKSWLFRKFADSKPAVVLVADRRLATTQMQRFAQTLEPAFGVLPEIPDLPGLFEVLYRLGREQKVLAVIDEFPYLLSDGAARERVLSEIQAVMEQERDSSQTKLILCGSVIGQMEALLEASSPLHGRLRALDVRPLTFAESTEMRDAKEPPEKKITRFAVAGGMARYLAELGSGGDLESLVCERVLDRRGPLFNDPRGVLEQELRSPASYFSLLEELSLRPAQTEHLRSTLGMSSSGVLPIIRTLQAMRLLDSALPVGAPPNARSRMHFVADGFIRFWFRFVFPHQEALENGLRPEDLWEAEIAPQLADFVGQTFEQLCRAYTRRNHGATAPRVGGWWGKALNEHRRVRSRMTEEIDVVGARHKRLEIVGECKWASEPLPVSIVDDLVNFKVPAIAEEGRLRVPKGGPRILLFSRSGFSKPVEERAAADPSISLIGLEQLIDGLG